MVHLSLATPSSQVRSFSVCMAGCAYGDFARCCFEPKLDEAAARDEGFIEGSLLHHKTAKFKAGTWWIARGANHNCFKVDVYMMQKASCTADDHGFCKWQHTFKNDSNLRYNTQNKRDDDRGANDKKVCEAMIGINTTENIIDWYTTGQGCGMPDDDA